MGMFDNEEHTLFKPAPVARPATGGQPAAGGGGAPAPMMMMRGAADDDEGASLTETVSFAFRSARRRKLLSFLIAVLGGALTFAAAKLAPRDFVPANERVAQAEQAKKWLAELSSGNRPFYVFRNAAFTSPAPLPPAAQAPAEAPPVAPAAENLPNP